MKICFFVGFYPLIKGGAEYQMKLISSELLNDAEVFFISVGHTHNKVIYDGKIKVYTLNLNFTHLNKISLYYLFFNHIRTILNKEKPDLIYQRILNSFSYHLASYSQQRKIPFYIHIADCYSLKFGRGLSDRVRLYMFQSVLRSNVKFVVQTDEQKALLAEWNVDPVLKIYNLHPLNENVFLSLPKSYSTQRNIVWIGSARPVKRLDLFLDLALKYKENCLWKFTVIGRLGVDNYANTLFQKMSQLDNVEYLGEQDNDYINKYLSETVDLLVNTSDSEGFSNTFIQAWLRGVPVISLNSDPDHILTKYKLGVYCNNNKTLLSDSLSKILSDDKLYSQMKNNALRESPKLFSLNLNMYKLRKILDIK